MSHDCAVSRASLGAPYSVQGVSPILFVVVLAYASDIHLVYLDQQMVMKGTAEHPPQEKSVPTRITMPKAIAGFVACAVVIVVAGPYLAHAAEQLAELSGLSAPSWGPP